MFNYHVRVYDETITFDIASIEVDPDFHLISRDNQVLLSNESFQLESQLQVFPNPSETFFNIKKPDNLTIETIQVYNMLGQLVLETSYKETISLEDVASGVHFVRFSTNKGTLHKSLLKK